MLTAAMGRDAGWLVALGVTTAIGCGSSPAGEAPDHAGLGADAAPLGPDSSDLADAQAVADAMAHDGEGGKDASDEGSAHDAAASADSATGRDSGHEAGSPNPDAAVGTLYAIPLTTTTDSFVYEAELTIGDQTFAMDIDTGSTTVAVASSTCRSCTGISPEYTPTTGIDQDVAASSMYQDQSGWSGEVYSDTAGLEHGTPEVSLRFAAITQQTEFFEGNSYQGILGLDTPINAEPDTNAYLTLVQAKGVGAVTSFELCNTSGTMWLGGYDAAAASAAPTYTPMLAFTDSNPFYSLNIDDLKVGGTSVGFATAADFEEPIVDTGTSLFYLPDNIFDATLAAINAASGMQSLFAGQQLAAEGCVTAAGVTSAMVDAQLPALSIDVPSTTTGAPDSTITVSASRSYLYDNGNGQFCLAIDNGGTENASTLGLTFLRAFVTILDNGSGRIGFAPDLGCTAGGGMRVVHPRPWPPKSRPPRVRRF
jgi:hypothetical protein